MTQEIALQTGILITAVVHKGYLLRLGPGQDLGLRTPSNGRWTVTVADNGRRNAMPRAPRSGELPRNAFANTVSD